MFSSSLRSLLIVSGLGLFIACGTTPDPDAGATPDDGGSADAGTDAGPIDCAGRPSAAPSGRSEVGMIYDGARNRLVIYGGNPMAPVDCNIPLNPPASDEMWVFHLDCNNWERLTPAGGPGPLRRQATVYDASRERMLMFGGRGPGSPFPSYLNAVWAFDLTTDTWSEVTTSGTPPPGLGEAIAQIDVARDRMLVFGGNPGGFTGSTGMFALDLATNTWTEITAAGAPTPRLYHASAILGDELIVFGGTNSFNGPYYNDTYAFNMTTDTWRSISTSTVPRTGVVDADGTFSGGRFGMEIIADPERNRVLMAFGHDGGNLGNSNDMWALDVGAGAWTELHTGDTLIPENGPTGMCMFPADFTAIEEGAPERRYSIGLAHAGDRAYIFGGKADCGYLNDVWSVDLASGDWTLVRASTGGEVCLRTGRTDCASLCF